MWLLFAKHWVCEVLFISRLNWNICSCGAKSAGFPSGVFWLVAWWDWQKREYLAGNTALCVYVGLNVCVLLGRERERVGSQTARFHTRLVDSFTAQMCMLIHIGALPVPSATAHQGSMGVQRNTSKWSANVDLFPCAEHAGNTLKVLLLAFWKESYGIYLLKVQQNRNGRSTKKYIGIETDVLAEHKNLNKGRKRFFFKEINKWPSEFKACLNNYQLNPERVFFFLLD